MPSSSPVASTHPGQPNNSLHNTFVLRKAGGQTTTQMTCPVNTCQNQRLSGINRSINCPFIIPQAHPKLQTCDTKTNISRSSPFSYPAYPSKPFHGPTPPNSRFQVVQPAFECRGIFYFDTLLRFQSLCWWCYSSQTLRYWVRLSQNSVFYTCR